MSKPGHPRPHPVQRLSNQAHNRFNTSFYFRHESLPMWLVHGEFQSTENTRGAHLRQAFRPYRCWFYSDISLPLVFDIFKAKLQAGILKGKVQDRPGKSKRLIYYCPLHFAVGTYSVRRRRRGIKHYKTCCVRVVCATSKCSNRFCQTGLVPRVVITIFPDGGHNQRSLIEDEAYGV